MGQGLTSSKVYVLLQASKEIDRLPGRVRQRVRRAGIGLRDDPAPSFLVAFLLLLPTEQSWRRADHDRHL